MREIISRLGFLNVINPLKLAYDYNISLKHLDNRILLTTLLEISPQEGTDQIKEHPRTEVSVLTFYGALHRIVAVKREETLLFTYCDFGQQTSIVAWGLRRDAVKKFLVGTSPIDRGMYRIVRMHREMEQNGTFSRGPIELQYTTHLKNMKQIRRTNAAAAADATTTTALNSPVAITRKSLAIEETSASMALPAERESTVEEAPKERLVNEQDQ